MGVEEDGTDQPVLHENYSLHTPFAKDTNPFAARRAFFQLLKEVASSGKGILLTTHDLGLAREFANEIVMLNNGKVSYEGPPNSALPDLLVAHGGLNGS